MAQLFTNNATSTLAADITNSATSLTVASGHGARFPSPTGDDYFLVTLEKTDGTREIVKVTARSTDTFTIVRAQEGTTGTAFTAGDVVELRVTAETLARAMNGGTSIARSRSANLLTNSGFEAGSLTGWDAVAGYDQGGVFTTSDRGTDASGTPRTGTYLWCPSSSARSAIQQTVDVSAYATQIDAHRVDVEGSIWIMVDHTVPDTAAFSIEALDASDAVLGATGSPTLQPRQNHVWFPVGARLALPAGTRSVRFTVYAERLDGTNNNSNIDNCELILLALSSEAVAIIDGAMKEITSVVTSGSQASVTISNIPQGYRDLKAVVFARGTDAAVGVTLGAQFNGDTGANYDFVRESRFGQASGFGVTRADFGAVSTAGSLAGVYTHCEIDIPGYALNGPHKTITSRQPVKQANALANVFNEMGEGFWRNGSPITQIVLSLGAGAFVDGSVITLYGVGGAASTISGFQQAVSDSQLALYLHNMVI